MGIFDKFTGKKKEEELARQEQLKEKAKEEEILELKKKYEELDWPVIHRLNPVSLKDDQNALMEETISSERKDEIGELIYNEELSNETLKFLNGQELLFLLTTYEVFNKKSPLPGYETGHRKVYNEVLSRIRDAEFLFVLYDKNSSFPYIDHGYGNIYFEEDIAEKAAGMFNKQFRNVEVRKCKVSAAQNAGASGLSYFDFLYYIGINNLIIDNGAYRARFKRNEIMPAPGEWSSEKKTMPVNPALNFAMLDFLEEVRWPVKYEKRDELIKAKEIRLLSTLRASHLIVPVQHEGPAEMLEDGRIKLNKDTKLKFLIMKTKDDKQFLPVYTDTFEFSKLAQNREWNAGVFAYNDILRFISDKDGIRINPDGQGLVLATERLKAFEEFAQKNIKK